MRLPILAGTAAALLAGCSGTMPEPMAPAMFDELANLAPACKRGAVDAHRVFLLCPAGNDTQGDAALAMKQRLDPTLDIAGVAAEYGIARQSVTGIEAATYARIVGSRPEVKARGKAGAGQPIIIDGRTFRKVTLKADGKAPQTLFVEK